MWLKRKLFFIVTLIYGTASALLVFFFPKHRKKLENTHASRILRTDIFALLNSKKIK